MISVGAGIAGGILVGRTALQKKRTTLGIPVPTLQKKPAPIPVPKLEKKRSPISAPNKKIEFRGLAEQVGEAGRQFGRLAQEIRMLREKAEQVARSVS